MQVEIMPILENLLWKIEYVTLPKTFYEGQKSNDDTQTRQR